MQRISLREINVGKLVDMIFLIGVSMFGGGMICMVGGSLINTAWFPGLVGSLFPVVVVGIVAMFGAVKLSVVFE